MIHYCVHEHYCSTILSPISENAVCANAVYGYDRIVTKICCLFVQNSIFKEGEVPQMTIRIHYHLISSQHQEIIQDLLQLLLLSIYSGQNRIWAAATMKMLLVFFHCHYSQPAKYVKKLV